MNFATAKERINVDCPLDAFPPLTDRELRSILAESKIVDSAKYLPDNHAEWLPSTYYALGATVTPSTRNGRYYTVTIAGTSGAVEPTWPITVGNTVVSGTVTFSCTGAVYWAVTYDHWYAVARAWEMKAAKVANMTQQTVDGQSFNPHQLRPAFLDNARLARRKRGIRSQAIHTSTARRRPRETAL